MIDTLDPVFETSHLRDDNYFYYMPLMLKYSPLAAGNPAYLSEAGYDVLRSEPHRLDAIKIHTDYINNVLNDQVSDGELTCVILMDHLDWFSRQDCLQELELVYAKMAKSGRVFWRSAGKCPWYNDLFEQVGFTIKACQIRQGDTMLIDRVNMYKSHWQGVKE